MKRSPAPTVSGELWAALVAYRAAKDIPSPKSASKGNLPQWLAPILRVAAFKFAMFPEFMAKRDSSSQMGAMHMVLWTADLAFDPVDSDMNGIFWEFFKLYPDHVLALANRIRAISKSREGRRLSILVNIINSTLDKQSSQAAAAMQTLRAKGLSTKSDAKLESMERALRELTTELSIRSFELEHSRAALSLFESGNANPSEKQIQNAMDQGLVDSEAAMTRLVCRESKRLSEDPKLALENARKISNSSRDLINFTRRKLAGKERIKPVDRRKKHPPGSG